MNIVQKIGDYLDAVKKGIQNGDKIIEAISVATKVKNAENGDYSEITPEVIAEIMRRKDICGSCQFNSIHATARGTYRSGLDYTHCILCKCRIGGENTKEYSLQSECGAASWNERNPDLVPLEVKWGKIEKK
jgi:hypothetical protein